MHPFDRMHSAARDVLASPCVWALLRQVRAVMQKKLCRPVPLEMIGSLTVATLRELAAEVGGGAKSGGASAAPAEAQEVRCQR